MTKKAKPVEFKFPAPIESALVEAATSIPFADYEKAVMRIAVTAILALHKGNVTHAAEGMGYSRRTLQRYIKQHKLTKVKTSNA